MRLALHATAALASLAASPSAAVAEPGNSFVADEIIVTARRREEALSAVPLSVTALSAAQIEARGVRNLEDLAAFAPGLNYSKQASQRGGRSESIVRFRGMDINDVAPTRQLASVFVDGVYVAGGLSSLSFEDVERVEVIKGPQSALFGRSTFGGAVNFIARRPADRFGVRGSLLLAEGETIDGSLSIEGPIFTDRLRARVTGRYYSTEGRYRSIADGGKLGAEETKSVNLILEAEPLDGLRIGARAFLSEDNDGAPTTFALTRDLHNCGPFFPGGVTYFCGQLPQVRTFGTNTRLDETTRAIFVDNVRGAVGLARGPRLDRVGLRRQNERFALSITADLDAIDGEWTTLGALNEIRQKRILDLDFTPRNIWLEGSFQEIRDWAIETRVAGKSGNVSWLLGGSVFDMRFETPNGSIAWLFPNSAFPNGFFLNQTIGRTDVRTLAAFGSIGWTFAPAWTLNLEARYQSDRLDQGIVAGRPLKATFNNFLPRVILQWRPDETTNLYLTYAKGNKPGDFNTTVVALTPAQKDEVFRQTGATEIVGEERLDNYEFGLKKTLADGRISINSAFYYMQWKNQQNRTQATITDPSTPAGIRFVPVIISAGATDLWGIEAELSMAISREVQLSSTFNWAASEYRQFLCGFCARLIGTPDMAGRQSPRFPEITSTLGLSYDKDLDSGLGVFGRADLIYTSGAYDEAFNTAQNADTWKLNVRAGIRRDFWNIEVFVQNLFDNRDYVAAARFTDFTRGNFNLNDFVSNVTPGEPRQVGVRAGVRF